MTLLGGQGEHFGLGLGEMFEGDSADMCARKFPLMLMGGRVEGLACAYLESGIPIGVSGICVSTYTR